SHRTQGKLLRSYQPWPLHPKPPAALSWTSSYTHLCPVDLDSTPATGAGLTHVRWDRSRDQGPDGWLSLAPENTACRLRFRLALRPAAGTSKTRRFTGFHCSGPSDTL